MASSPDEPLTQFGPPHPAYNGSTEPCGSDQPASSSIRQNRPVCGHKLPTQFLDYVSPTALPAHDPPTSPCLLRYDSPTVPRRQHRTPPPTFIIILVFKIKRHFDGSIECFEARLVAKSYTQVEGLNFSWDLHSRGRFGYGWVSSHSGRYSWLRVAPVRCAKCILAPRSQGGSMYASPAWIQVIPNGQSLPPSQILLQSPSSLP